MKLQFTSRRIAGTLAGIGLGIGLIGGGVLASYSDQATATNTVKAGTFGIEISSAQGVVGTDKKSVTYTAPDILSSAAGNSPFAFTVKSTGSVPVKVHVTQSPLPMAAPFSSMLADPVADVSLNKNETHDYAAGIQWSVLSNPDVGTTKTITYTINALESSAPYQAPVPTFMRVGNVFTIAINYANGEHSWDKFSISPGDVLSGGLWNATYGTDGNQPNLAVADSNGVIRYTGNGMSCIPIYQYGMSGWTWSTCAAGPGPAGNMQFFVTHKGTNPNSAMIGAL